MKKLAMVLLCSLYVMVSVQSTFAAKTAPKGSAGSPAAEMSVAAPLNINAAEVESLTSLPGIGQKMAERISAYRDENGPFKSVDDLLNVKGIGPKVLEKIRPLVSVS